MAPGSQVGARAGALGFVATCVACGAQGAPPSAQPLSPLQPHYGKSYAEWAAAWVQWVYQWPETEACPDPIADQSGALCGFAQDPNSPVFFLAGNWGGVTRRTDCVVPANKALLVPIIATFQDNGAVPEANQKTDSHLRDSAIAEFQSVSDVHFALDGQSLGTLGSYAIMAAPYEYTLPPEPNIFTCQGSPGVTGSYRGYTSGYFVLLPPLAPGAHTIAFTAKEDMANSPPFTLDVEYNPVTIR